MSHTTEISAIVFTDMDALRATVADLNKSGVRCSLVPDATPRAFYANQNGLGAAPFVLRLEDSPYDVGFYPNGKGGFLARTDLWGGHIASQLGVPVAQQKAGEAAAQNAMGKLFQGYAVNAAVRQAAKQGYRVIRSTRPDGSVQLTMSV